MTHQSNNQTHQTHAIINPPNPTKPWRSNSDAQQNPVPNHAQQPQQTASRIFFPHKKIQTSSSVCEITRKRMDAGSVQSDSRPYQAQEEKCTTNDLHDAGHET